MNEIILQIVLYIALPSVGAVGGALIKHFFGAKTVQQIAEVLNGLPVDNAEILDKHILGRGFKTLHKSLKKSLQKPT